MTPAGAMPVGTKTVELALETALGAAWRRAALVRAVEGALVGLAAAGIAVALGVRSGGLAAEAGPWLAASLAGLAAAATWWLEHRPDRRRLALRIDRATVGDGSFVTALECERKPSGALAQALVRRTRARLEPGSLRRAVAPPALALVAAPLLAGALASLSLEAGPPARALAARSLRVLAAVVGEGAPAGTGPSPAAQAELAGLVEDAVRAWRGEDAAGLEAALERVTRLDGPRSAEREDRTPASQALARGFDLARAAVDGLRDPDPRGVPDRSGLTRRDRGERGQGLEGDRAAARMAGSDGAATGAATDPRSAGPAGSGAGAGEPKEGAAKDTAAGAGLALRESAVVVVRTWDPRHDGVVEAWLRRAAPSNEPANER